jgi:hypothetical protein
MKKLRMLGMSHREKRVEFRLEKSQEFVPIMRKVSEEVVGKTGRDLFDDYDDKKGHIDLVVENCVDYCENLDFPGLDLDIFFGTKKIILVLRSPKKKRKFIKALEKYCKWAKPLKPKKVKVLSQRHKK